MYVSAVILPDGRVLETGGATGYRMNPTSAYVKSTQILDPKTMTWTKAPDATVGRTYHSGALLLPDGRVLTFGGNPCDGSFEMNLEIYSPGYMTKTAAAITSAPTERHLGHRVHRRHRRRRSAPRCSSARRRSRTRRTRTSAASTSGCRRVTATGATLTIPANHNITPPGWYMLFVRGADGTPSVAKWVKVA